MRAAGAGAGRVAHVLGEALALRDVVARVVGPRVIGVDETQVRQCAVGRLGRVIPRERKKGSKFTRKRKKRKDSSTGHDIYFEPYFQGINPSSSPLLRHRNIPKRTKCISGYINGARRQGHR